MTALSNDDSRRGSAGYRLLEHTADMGIAAWGESEKALFLQAAEGLREMIFGESSGVKTREEVVEVEGHDRSELLVNWLNEILYLFEIRRLLPLRFSIDSLEEDRMKATVAGTEFDPDSHAVEREVKAATFHQLKFERTGDGWAVRLFVDL